MINSLEVNTVHLTGLATYIPNLADYKHRLKR